MLRTYIVHDDMLLPLVTVPPLVAELWISVWVIFTSLAALSDSCITPDPHTSEGVLVTDHQVILANLL